MYLYILTCMFCFCVGYFLGKIIDKKSTYGVITVDDKEESYFFKMNSDDIKNNKYKKVIFSIEHKK